MIISEKVIVIDGGYFYAGLIVVDRKVIFAAPILRYMIGWDGKKVKDYCLKKIIQLKPGNEFVLEVTMKICN